MNKHGQTLILFVILIPIMILLCAVVVDTSYLIGKKTNLREVTKNAISEVLVKNKDKSAIKDILIENKIDVDNLEVIEKDGEVEVKNKIEVDSIFASIIGIKTYDIKIDIIGINRNGKIIFE